MRLDRHVHTYHSSDSRMTPVEIVRAVVRQGLGGLAITDHNSIAGALEVREIAPFVVIVGEEINTAEGEIIGLFLQHAIPPGLSPEETIAAIRQQNGVVYVPHPLDSFRRSALRRSALERLIGQIDALEVFNARNLLPWDNEHARQLALTRGLAMGAGSDAHTAGEIGNGWVEVEPFTDARSFLTALRRGRAGGVLSSPLVHFATRWTKLRRRLWF